MELIYCFMIVLYQKRKVFGAASYDTVMVVISSKTLLVANQPNHYQVLLFHLLTFLLFAVLHQNDFLLFQYFQHWMAHVINLQQQRIIFLLNKCQVEERENLHTTEITHPKTNSETSEIQRKDVCTDNLTFTMKNMCNMAYFRHFQVTLCSV